MTELLGDPGYTARLLRLVHAPPGAAFGHARGGATTTTTTRSTSTSTSTSTRSVGSSGRGGYGAGETPPGPGKRRVLMGLPAEAAGARGVSSRGHGGRRNRTGGGGGGGEAGDIEAGIDAEATAAGGTAGEAMAKGSAGTYKGSFSTTAPAPSNSTTTGDVGSGKRPPIPPGIAARLEAENALDMALYAEWRQRQVGCVWS